jgi:hypothetical protein
MRTDRRGFSRAILGIELGRRGIGFNRKIFHMGPDRGITVVMGAHFQQVFGPYGEYSGAGRTYPIIFGKNWVIWKNLDFLGKIGGIGKIWKLGPWRPTSDRSKLPGPPQKERSQVSLALIIYQFWI